MFLAPGIASRVDLGPEAMADARKLLADFVEARRTLDLPPRPGSGCRACPHRPSCPAGQAHLAAAPSPVATARGSGSLWALAGR